MGDTGECFPARDEHRYGALRDKLRSASAVAVVDEFARHALAGLDAGGPTPQVIRMGVDPSVFMPNLQSNQGDRPFTVLTVGRLAPEKDLGTVLRAFATANPGNWRLRVVGDGPFRSRLHQEALALGLGSSVEFLGHRAPCELPRLYNSSDVVAMSSRSEGIPTVLMEAMACGVPVVATRVGGIPELVIEGTGTLVQVGDVAALAAALSALAGDAAAARRSGARARQHILAHYDVGGRAATWSRFLRQAMSEQAPRLGEPAQKTADREHH